MTYDVEKIRSNFRSLDSGIAFFDGPGGSQVPTVVGNAISDAITSPVSNRGQTTESEKFADNSVKGNVMYLFLVQCLILLVLIPIIFLLFG
jgi:selenocysteine lyase/cysteine desulfurase